MTEPRQPCCLLLSTYDLGHQPRGLATAARRLADAGFDVACLDLAVDGLDAESVTSAAVIALYVPMHTATRLALALLPRLRTLNPAAVVIAFGLYATLNEDSLRSAGVDVIVSERSEAAIVTAALGAVTSAPTAYDHAVAGQHDVLPQRRGLAGLDRYVRLRLDPEGTERLVGRTDASRGCRHRCRHCPIPAVYEGRFSVVDPRIVAGDVDQLVAAGAQHLTFGDPDFFNGPLHGLRIVREMRRRHPDLSWDCTIKVSHLLRYRRHLAELAELGCILITTAVESFDENVLALLGKGHTVADFENALDATREVGIGLNPTFVAFSPLTTLASYRRFLVQLRRLDLYRQVAPIQLAIRLLITKGSALLSDPTIGSCAGPFDPAALVHPWTHPDPRVDALQSAILAMVTDRSWSSRSELFAAVWDRVGVGSDEPIDAERPVVSAEGSPIPYLDEPWYC